MPLFNLDISSQVSRPSSWPRASALPGVCAERRMCFVRSRRTRPRAGTARVIGLHFEASNAPVNRTRLHAQFKLQYPPPPPHAHSRAHTQTRARASADAPLTLQNHLRPLPCAACLERAVSDGTIVMNSAGPPMDAVTPVSAGVYRLAVPCHAFARHSHAVPCGGCGGWRISALR